MRLVRGGSQRGQLLYALLALRTRQGRYHTEVVLLLHGNRAQIRVHKNAARAALQNFGLVIGGERNRLAGLGVVKNLAVQKVIV